MALFIGQVRDELTNLWKTKCFVNDVAFRFLSPNFAGLTSFSESDFGSEIYTEELLEKHEHEADYWRNFVDRNKKIIDGVSFIIIIFYIHNSHKIIQNTCIY